MIVPEQEVDESTDLTIVGERIEALLGASSSGGALARERSEELVRLVTDLYGAGIERIMELLHERGRLDDEVLEAMASDELVSGLLIVHGLHPYGVEDRVERALESVRPYLGSHGGDVELLEVSEEGVVRLRLLGSCDGCPSSSVTLELAVEGAIQEAAPEVSAIEIETAADTEPHGPLIPVGSLFTRLEPSGPSAAGSSWQAIPELAQLVDGGVVVVSGPTDLLGCRVDKDIFVFHDRCARCESSLAGAVLARRLGGDAGDALLTCPSCRAHFEVRRAGACVEEPDLHLGPLPVLADGSRVSVAVPAVEPA
jgi:Fe-S cluster biogenesis protein NfuA/nitrite reductase/ring-hydroxylating ferredoxin subunit